MSPEDREFFDSFKPVPPTKGEHDWRLSPTGHLARCERCRLCLAASLSQIQQGHAVSADLVIAGTDTRYDTRKHGQCSW